MPADINHFHLPLYREIPNVGLYLEQTVKYINECLKPLGCIKVTPSMISNYVKKGYVTSPLKKQYDATQIAQSDFYCHRQAGAEHGEHLQAAGPAAAAL